MSNIIGTFVPVIKNCSDMARPASADTAYKIIIHTNGKRRYASTKVCSVGENGKKTYVHKHWGTVDEDNKFHPNATYFYAKLEDRQKLVFPSGWDLSEAERLSGTKHRGRIAYEADDVDRKEAHQHGCHAPDAGHHRAEPHGPVPLPRGQDGQGGAVRR